MIVLKKAVICCGILFFSFCISHSVSGTELVGVLPLSNQRYQKKNDWLGFYIQARIKTNLGINSDWQFHGQNVLGLWALRLDRSLPITPLTTILIDGSFQQVASLGHISVKLTRYNADEEVTVKFEQPFVGDRLDASIDDLSLKIGRWIQPGFNLVEKADFPHHEMPAKKELFSLRRSMYEAGKTPDVRTVLFLEDLVSVNSPYELICDLGEAMIVLSQLLEVQEQKRVLKKTEKLLRKAILKNKEHARLYALLAEVYYLSGSYASWIEKTADDAIELDPQSDLGYLLKTLVSESETDVRSKDIEHLRQINPWLFSKTVDGSAYFQKGILREELSRLNKTINSTN